MRTRTTPSYHVSPKSLSAEVRKKKAFESIQNILSRALGKHGLDREIARYKFVLHWNEIVGDEIARRAKADSIRGTTLMVRVSDSAWAQELSFQKGVILKRLKKYLSNGETVRDIQFFVS